MKKTGALQKAPVQNGSQSSCHSTHPTAASAARAPRHTQRPVPAPTDRHVRFQRNRGGHGHLFRGHGILAVLLRFIGVGRHVLLQPVQVFPQLIRISGRFRRKLPHRRRSGRKRGRMPSGTGRLPGGGVAFFVAGMDRGASGRSRLSALMGFSSALPCACAIRSTLFLLMGPLYHNCAWMSLSVGVFFCRILGKPPKERLLQQRAAPKGGPGKPCAIIRPVSCTWRTWPWRRPRSC